MAIRSFIQQRAQQVCAPTIKQRAAGRGRPALPPRRQRAGPGLTSRHGNSVGSYSRGRSRRGRRVHACHYNQAKSEPNKERRVGDASPYLQATEGKFQNGRHGGRSSKQGTLGRSRMPDPTSRHGDSVIHTTEDAASLRPYNQAKSGGSGTPRPTSKATEGRPRESKTWRLPRERRAQPTMMTRSRVPLQPIQEWSIERSCIYPCHPWLPRCAFDGIFFSQIFSFSLYS